jgi:hypothetical protein
MDNLLLVGLLLTVTTGGDKTIHNRRTVTWVREFKRWPRIMTPSRQRSHREYCNGEMIN